MNENKLRLPTLPDFRGHSLVELYINKEGEKKISLGTQIHILVFVRASSGHLKA